MILFSADGIVTGSDGVCGEEGCVPITGVPEVPGTVVVAVGMEKSGNVKFCRIESFAVEEVIFAVDSVVLLSGDEAPGFTVVGFVVVVVVLGLRVDLTSDFFDSPEDSLTSFVVDSSVVKMYLLENGLVIVGFTIGSP